MKNIFKSLFFVASLSLTTCKKNNTPPTNLPPATQIGANTFGCKINGEVWVPYSPCASSAFPCDEMHMDFLHANPNSILPISFTLAMQRQKDNKTSYFHIFNIDLLFPPHNYFHSTGNIYDSLDIEYNTTYHSHYGPGQFEITKLDTINKIISGVFNFKLYYESDSISVTDGRFDFKIESI